jgi:hypothetical protein
MLLGRKTVHLSINVFLTAHASGRSILRDQHLSDYQLLVSYSRGNYHMLFAMSHNPPIDSMPVKGHVDTLNDINDILNKSQAMSE